jgi:hypothetical protein
VVLMVQMVLRAQVEAQGLQGHRVLQEQAV